MIFWLIKKVFIVLLSFSGSLATKCVSLSNETCVARPTLINLNPIGLKYYPFMVTPDKCNKSFYVVDDLSTNICVPSKTKEVNVKIFNLIAKIHESKTLVKHISCNCKCKFNSPTCNSNQKWNKETCQW